MRRLMTRVGWLLLACAGMPAQAQAQAQAQMQVQAQPQSQSQSLRELTLVNGALPSPQRLIVATKGDVLRWRLVSDLPGEVHVHAYRVSVALRPGLAAELAFTAHATGRFRVEWHAADGAGSGGAASGGHHAPPLAVLEVRPR